jgi:putative lipoic acid-binding regulatory protein
MSDQTSDTHKTSLIDYPCDFPIKVMGKQEPQLAQQLVDIVLQYDPQFDSQTVEIRHSKQGNYVGLTFTIRATSREQLDAVYRALHGHPMVSLVL